MRQLPAGRRPWPARSRRPAPARRPAARSASRWPAAKPVTAGFVSRPAGLAGFPARRGRPLPVWLPPPLAAAAVPARWFARPVLTEQRCFWRSSAEARWQSSTAGTGCWPAPAARCLRRRPAAAWRPSAFCTGPVRPHIPPVWQPAPGGRRPRRPAPRSAGSGPAGVHRSPRPAALAAPRRGPPVG